MKASKKNMKALGFEEVYIKKTKNSKEFGEIPEKIEYEYYADFSKTFSPSKVWEKQINCKCDGYDDCVTIYVFKQGSATFYVMHEIEDKFCVKINRLEDIFLYINFQIDPSKNSN